MPKFFPMRLSSKRSAKLLAVLLMSSCMGAGGTFLLTAPSRAADTGPVIGQPAPQSGFAPLVTRVKPAVVQISTIFGGAKSGSEDGQKLQQSPNMPDLDGPFGEMLRRYFGQQ